MNQSIGQSGNVPEATSNCMAVVLGSDVSFPQVYVQP